MDDYEAVVSADYPWKTSVKDGNEGVFCNCGRMLQIKRPKTKTWHKVKCPECGFVINVYCGG